MRIMKKISAILLALFVCVPCVSTIVYASDGSISFTDLDTAVGEMVDIRCVIRSGSGNIGDMDIKLNYDSAALRFNSGDGVTAESDGVLAYKGTGSSSEEEFTMTFQALAEGSTKVTVSSMTVTSSSGTELSLDQGDSTVNIAAGDPSKIQDVPESSAEDIQVEVNGETYTLTDKFADADIPSGYTRTSVTLEGQERQMVVNESGSLYLAYLLNSENLGDFFIYNENDATFYPYEEIAISDTTSIVVLSDTSKVKLPDNYMEAQLTLNDKKFPVWQDKEHDGYYILYAMNNSGETGYYQYDSTEGTYQKVDVSDTKEEKKEKVDNSLLGKIKSFLDKHFKLFILIAGLGAIIILIILIVLAVKLRNRNLELDDLYDEYGIDLEDEEREPDMSGKRQENVRREQVRDEENDFGEDSFDDSSFLSLDDDDSFRNDDFDDDYDDDDYDDDDYDDDDYSQDDDFDEDIFADEALGKYDTHSIGLGASMDAIDTEDDLDELLESLTGRISIREKKEDTFNVDFIDLD